MKIRCEYCDNFIDDSDEKCPFCGAPNGHLRRSASGIPKTIEELRAFAQAHKLPLEKMRFFLGQDYRGARAFGIYRDEDGNFVVYKNKANGERAVRYRGKDEAYAVNELYQKMRTEVQNQKARRGVSYVSRPAKKKKWYQTKLAKILGVILAFLLIGSIADRLTPDKGYYSYNDGYYYYDSSDWYEYDPELDDWRYADVETFSALNYHYADYYEGDSYSSGAQYEDFYVSDYYHSDDYSAPESYTWDNDWDDSDWDWDWDDDDSWDSDSTDWDSDW